MDENTRKLIKEDTLCSNNLLVKFYLTSLKKMLKRLGVTDEEVYMFINDSLEVLRVMKKQGQHMEDRLRLFNYAVCNILGYKRERKKKS